MSEITTIENDIKIDFHKVIAILRALLPGDHEAIHEVKKLAGVPIVAPESSGPANDTIPPAQPASPAPVAGDTIAATVSGADTVA